MHPVSLQEVDKNPSLMGIGDNDYGNYGKMICHKDKMMSYSLYIAVCVFISWRRTRSPSAARSKVTDDGEVVNLYVLVFE